MCVCVCGGGGGGHQVAVMRSVMVFGVCVGGGGAPSCCNAFCNGLWKIGWGQKLAAAIFHLL